MSSSAAVTRGRKKRAASSVEESPVGTEYYGTRSGATRGSKKRRASFVAEPPVGTENSGTHSGATAAPPAAKKAKRQASGLEALSSNILTSNAPYDGVPATTVIRLLRLNGDHLDWVPILSVCSRDTGGSFLLGANTPLEPGRLRVAGLRSIVTEHRRHCDKLGPDDRGSDGSPLPIPRMTTCLFPGESHLSPIATDGELAEAVREAVNSVPGSTPPVVEIYCRFTKGEKAERPTIEER